MTFSKTHTSEEPGLEIASRIGFLVLKISSMVIFANGESAAT